ncbi:hypothetical protein F3Y22_tig00116964pilonHSYRG00138 [Hibiscus syriacus]|uniref:Uncharacterized protein n=1 Tax=Hibiscus syriacus TaxID=106335 RepID=A0A6A2WUR8_HIBSY|nr:hypothetical protein F3Y22_tig00116964pilonHSYRG00138 [Hibiscus syriacus]
MSTRGKLGPSIGPRMLRKTRKEKSKLTQVAAATVAIGILLILLVVYIRRCCYRKDIADDKRAVGTKSFQDGIAELYQASLHHHHHIDLDNKRRMNYYILRRGVSVKPLFNWVDHPYLITDAVENGWSRFGFTKYMSSPSTRLSLLVLCATGDFGGGNDIEVNWEVFQGSTDFMQKIRINSGSKKGSLGHHSMEAASVIRTALPLPGPPLWNSAFPQEAYFEIRILYCRGDDHDSSSSGKLREGEKTKVIEENSNPNANSESLVQVTSSHDINTIEELKHATRDDGKGEAVMLSMGLTAGDSLPSKLPGSYPGSIGFNSDGSVYLDGN